MVASTLFGGVVSVKDTPSLFIKARARAAAPAETGGFIIRLDRRGTGTDAGRNNGGNTECYRHFRQTVMSSRRDRRGQAQPRVSRFLVSSVV